MFWFAIRCIVLFGFWSGATGFAAPILSGVSFFQANANGNNGGQFWGYPGIQVWVQENGNWISASNGQLNLSLTNGTHTFNFYASGNGVVLSQAGVNINLGATCTNGISVRGSSGSSSFAANTGTNTFWPASVTPNCSGGNAAGSGSLSWTNGTDIVTLTQFTYTDHASSGVNLVSYRSINPIGSPDGIPDHAGTFTLLVNPQASNVPEPATFLLLATGCIIALGERQLRKTHQARP